MLRDNGVDPLPHKRVASGAALFVSIGSTFSSGDAETPTLTIVALAIRQVEYIAEKMGQNNL
jgi:choline dehydrogenase-like flavoprotein